MKKTLTAIVVSAALGLGALTGCGSREKDPQAIRGQQTIKVPNHDGELVYAGLNHVGQHHVVFKNTDGTITTYSGDDMSSWHRNDYQKGEKK